MEVKLTNGKTAKLQLKGSRLKTIDACKSKFQYNVGQKLKETYPHDLIFEEVFIPGEKFILDFFIPSLSVVVECHGEQHTKHIKHFHKTKHKFHQQQERDQRKRDWCELNRFKLIEISYNE